MNRDMTSTTLAIPPEQRPFCDEAVLVYYDGPQVFWLPCPGRRLLAFSVPNSAGPDPFLVIEVTESQAHALISNQLTVRGICLAAQGAWLMPDYGADTLVLEPLEAIPSEWLPGDVMLYLADERP